MLRAGGERPDMGYGHGEDGAERHNGRTGADTAQIEARSGMDAMVADGVHLRGEGR